MVQDSILLPILLIEHGGYSNMYMDSIKYNEITQVNRASRKAYEQIQSEGIKDVYYLSREDLNIPSDGWVDYVHPSDFGMKQQAIVVERKVREILHIPLGSLTTTIPVTQRREPHMYEWLSRHRAFLEQVRNHPPKAVILADHPLLGWRIRTPQQERTRGLGKAHATCWFPEPRLRMGPHRKCALACIPR